MGDIVLGMVIIVTNILIAFMLGTISGWSVLAISCGAFIVGWGVKTMSIKD